MKQINLDQSQCGAGKTKDIVNEVIEHFTRGISSIIVQPSTAQHNQTKGRILAINKDVDVVIINGTTHKELNTTIKSYNKETVVLIISSEKFKSFNWMSGWARWRLYIDESLQILSTFETNISVVGNALHEDIFSAWDMIEYNDQYSKLTIKNFSRVTAMRDNKSGDAVVNIFSDINRALLNPEIQTVYVRSDELAKFSINTQLNDIEAALVPDIQQLYKNIAALVLTELQRDEIVNLIPLGVKYITKFDKFKRDVLSRFDTRKLFTAYIVLNKEITDAFAETTMYGANFGNTLNAMIWGKNSFEVIKQFTKHDTIITAYVPAVDTDEEMLTWSKTKNERYPKIRNELIDHMQCVLCDEKFLFIDNKNDRELHLNNAVQLSHNCHGRNEYTEYSNIALFAACNFNGPTKQFLMSVFGISEYNIYMVNHLDLFYQAIMRTTARVEGNTTSINVWSLHPWVMMALQMEYFDNMEIIYVDTTVVERKKSGRPSSGLTNAQRMAISRAKKKAEALEAKESINEKGVNKMIRSIV